MKVEISDGKRTPRLALVVPDSGRTWCVMYDQIRKIPARSFMKGDVMIVRHPKKEGVMFMQVTEPSPDVLEFEPVQLAGKGDADVVDSKG